jgi:meso-butanediol dehydrogenase/(S,S)-butanediol dehydrogenase/diacetyl reductase
VSRRVLLIGSRSPIGRAITAAFTADGGHVVGVSLEHDDDPKLKSSLVLDVSTGAGADQAVAETLRILGGLDVLVLAAASQPAAPATDLTDAQWRSALDNTLDTAFYPARAALRVMGDGAGIVAVTSVNATLAAPWLAGYAAAKAGVEGLVRQLALEYGPRGIRVNAVAPGVVGDAGLPHDGYPLGRAGEPAEVAAAVRFLATAGFITGVVLPVDGGISIASPSAFLRPDLRARWLAD